MAVKIYMYLLKCVLLLYTCFGASEGNTLKYIRRSERKISPDFIVEQHVLRSKMECVAKCSSISSCTGVSWEESDHVCILADRNIATFGMDNWHFETSATWVTMIKIIYPVILYRGSAGQYTLSFNDAKRLCEEEGTTVATPSELLHARSMGYQYCICGWLADESNGFVMQRNVPGCFNYFTTDIHYCNWALADVYCSFK